MDRKEKVLENMQKTRDELLQELSRFPEEKWDEPVSQGKWTLRGFLVHITHWNRWGFNKFRCLVEQGEMPLGQPQDIDLLNERLAQTWELHSMEDVKADFHCQFQEMMDYLQRLPENWFEKKWQYEGKEVSVEEWFDFFNEHDATHIRQLRDMR